MHYIRSNAVSEMKKKRMEFLFTPYAMMVSLFSKGWLSPSLAEWSSFPKGWPSSKGLLSSSPELGLLSFFSLHPFKFLQWTLLCISHVLRWKSLSLNICMLTCVHCYFAYHTFVCKSSSTAIQYPYFLYTEWSCLNPQNKQQNCQQRRSPRYHNTVYSGHWL